MSATEGARPHILIAAHEVTNATTDRQQLGRTAKRAQKALVEHPFSTIKQAMGSTHFLTRRLSSVKAEMSLHVLAYNLKRAINVLGTDKILARLQPA